MPSLKDLRNRIRSVRSTQKITSARKMVAASRLRRAQAPAETGRPRVSFEEARDIAARILTLFEAGEFDVCTIIFNRFRSAITQIVTVQQLIPFVAPAGLIEEPTSDMAGAIYEFEPSEEEILAELLPNNLAVQIYTALLENAASEQGARMT